MSEKRETLAGLVADVLEGFRIDLQNQYDSDEDRLAMLEEPHDTVHEYADSGVPVYTGSLMQLAASDNNLATNTPEIGPAFDGSPTPVNIVAANVYEVLSEELFTEAVRLKEEIEERIEEAAEAIA